MVFAWSKTLQVLFLILLLTMPRSCRLAEIRWSVCIIIIGVAPSPTPWRSSHRKGSLRATLDYGGQLYLLYLFMYSTPCEILTQIVTGYFHWNPSHKFQPLSRTLLSLLAGLSSALVWMVSFLPRIPISNSFFYATVILNAPTMKFRNFPTF